jgi:acetyltransferase EpsM
MNEEVKQVKRVLIIGAGDGGEVVANIIRQMRDEDGYLQMKIPVGFLDDNKDFWGTTKDHLPVFGGVASIDEYKDLFDEVIISITSNLQVRQRLFDSLVERFVFINAVHPSASINPTAQLGTGNIIGGLVHIGHKAVISDNNLISSHSSIEHHNVIGSCNVFGPGVCTSGHVTIGNCCVFGMNVGVIPHVVIGDGCMIAGGSEVYSNLPEHSRIKHKIYRMMV